MDKKERLKVKFLRMVDDGLNDCWIWAGCKDSNGYGRWGQKKAHRIAYELWIGPIDDGLLVCHKCDVPACINPFHLFLGTPADNIKDAAIKSRMNPTYTDDDVRRIRAEFDAGRPIGPVVKEIGISYTLALRIAKRQERKHVADLPVS